MRRKSFVTGVVFTSINLLATIFTVLYYLDLPFTNDLGALALIILLPLLFIFWFVLLILLILGTIFSARAIKSQSKPIKIVSIVYTCINILIFLSMASMIVDFVLRMILKVY